MILSIYFDSMIAISLNIIFFSVIRENLLYTHIYEDRSEVIDDQFKLADFANMIIII